MDAELNFTNNEISSAIGSELMLTNCEVKNIKVIKSLENRAILLKGMTEKTINQKWRFLINIPGPLTSAGLLLMKNVLTSLAKSVLIPLGLTKAASVI